MMIKTGGKIVLRNVRRSMKWKSLHGLENDALWIFSFTQSSFSLPMVMQEMSVRSRTNNGAFLLSAQSPCNVIKMSG